MGGWRPSPGQSELARHSCRVGLHHSRKTRTAKPPTKMLQKGSVVKQLARRKCQTTHTPRRNNMHLHPQPRRIASYSEHSRDLTRSDDATVDHNKAIQMELSPNDNLSQEPQSLPGWWRALCEAGCAQCAQPTDLLVDGLMQLGGRSGTSCGRVSAQKSYQVLPRLGAASLASTPKIHQIQCNHARTRLKLPLQFVIS